MTQQAAHPAEPGAVPIDVPAGACDCHMHLFDPAVPFVPGAVLRPGEANAGQYLRLMRRLGIGRNVLVQPSSYGRDHRVLLAGLRRLGDSARGIAVIDPLTPADELLELRDHGVVGVRFNLVQAGATTADMLEPVARLIQPFGWHIQLHAHSGDLIGLADRLLALPVPVVIDHFARLHADVASTGHAERVEATVARLLASRRVWLKLSAPYIAAPGSPPQAALGGFVRRLADASLDQLVWGTDWPHVTAPDAPDDAALMQLLAHWFSPGERQRVLVENPARLYRFPAPLTAPAPGASLPVPL